jgi:hypothetical protein
VQFVNTIKDLWSNPTAKWVTLGGALRFFEAFTSVYFLPSFYQKVYPLMKSEFAILNGLIQGPIGAISILACGILADKLEKKTLMAKSYIGMIGGALAIPAIIGACWFKNTNFYLSLAFMAFKFLVSEGFMAPTITMM